MYYFDSRVRYSEVDHNSRLRIEAVINYFQDCSTFQSEDSGVGLEYCAARNRCWVLNSWEVKIKRLPMLGEHIRISTWPHGMNGFIGTRNFMLQDEDGQLLAIANSVWTFMDIEKQRPAKIDDETLAAYPLEPAYEGEWKGRKIKLMEGMRPEREFPVELNHLDTNKHVNNGQYVLMAVPYLPEDFSACSIRVEYRKAAVYGDVIFPYIYKEDNQVMVSLANETGTPYAVVEFMAE